MKRLILSLCVLFCVLSSASATVTTQQFTGTVVDNTTVTPMGLASAPPQTRISGTLTINTSQVNFTYLPENPFSSVKYRQIFYPGAQYAYQYFVGASFTINESSLSLAITNPSASLGIGGPYPGGFVFLICTSQQSNQALSVFPAAIPEGCLAGVSIEVAYRIPYNPTINPIVTFWIDRVFAAGQQPTVPANPYKPNGPGRCPCQNPQVGYPIAVSTGNMYEQVTDYATAGVNRLAFARYYNSQGNTASFAQSLGLKWRSSFDRYLRINSSSSMTAERPTGQEIDFTLQNGVWVPDSDVDYTLTGSGSNWTLTDSNDTVETYSTLNLQNQIKISATGATLTSIQGRDGYSQTLAYTSGNQLKSVTDSYQRVLNFTYENGLLQTVTTPDALVVSYGFAASGVTAGGALDRLASVTYTSGSQASTSQSYLYELPALPLALTGLLDENNHRYLSWTYDSLGRATSSQAGTATDDAPELTTLTYDNATGNTTVTNPLGQTETYKFTVSQGVPKGTEIDRVATATTKAATRSFSYDGNGYTATETDWDGNRTAFVNNAHGQPTKIVEAADSPLARTTSITYDPVWVHLPLKVTAPGVTTGFTYDSYGNTSQRTLTDTTTVTVPYSTNGQARIWKFTWGNYGLLATFKGPRTDVDTTSRLFYDASGSLTKITNALGQSIQVTQNTPGGRPLTIVDANGVTTQLAYDDRQRLTSQAVTTVAGVLTTALGYDPAGNLVSVTQPDGSTLTNIYDTAHRLIKVTDSLGNFISYTLDGLGDRKAVNIFARNGTSPAWQQSATFDSRGRLLVNTAGAGQTTTQTYDANGNMLSVADGLSQTTTNAYDALNRLSSSTDANGATTTPGYNAQDHVTSVQDGNGNTTSYVRDGFGEVIQQTSPDSGTTTYTYDADDNQVTKTDALGIVTKRTFDALNRPLTTTYPADLVENVSYSYDQTGTGFSFGIGRLTSVTDQAGSLTRTYDERGNLTGEKRVNGTATLVTGYSYDKASRVASRTYPDGTVVAYQHDAAGYISKALATLPGSQTATPLAVFTHQPFGPIGSVTYGNGVTEAWTFDQAYRASTITDMLSGANLQNLTYAYDAADNVKSITDAVNPANSQMFGYDTVNRLLNATSGTGGYGSLAWTYDKVGNRLTQLQGSTSTKYGYTSGTNRLLTITPVLPAAALSPPSLSPLKRTESASGSMPEQEPFGISTAQRSPPNARFAQFTGRVPKLVSAAYNPQTRQVQAPAVLPQAPPPSFSPEGGLFTSSRPGTISTPLTEATVHYTIDGTKPGNGSSVYTAPITVNQSLRLQAITVANGYSNSTVTVGDYTVLQAPPVHIPPPVIRNPPVIQPPTPIVPPIHLQPPSFTPVAGVYIGTQAVTLADATANVAIFYTLDGSTPTASSTRYTGPITVSRATTIKALAVSGNSTSGVASASYTIEAQTVAAVLTDLNGNITSIPPANSAANATFGYNNAGRLSQVTGSPMAATYLYDAWGQRISKANPGTPATLYGYAQDGSIQMENDGGTVTDYVYVDGRPIAQIQPGAAPAANQVTYVLADRLGTPQRLVNGSGATVWSTTYQPFGATGTITATVNQNLRFPGQFADAETGFSYNLNRDYMPNLGRYLESDPVGLVGGLSSYTYANNGPTRFTDTRGLEPYHHFILSPVDLLLDNLDQDDLLQLNLAVMQASPIAGEVLQEIEGLEAAEGIEQAASAGVPIESRAVSGAQCPIEHPFTSGGTHFTTAERLNQFASSPTYGPRGGSLFILPTSQADALLNAGATSSQLETMLGLDENALQGSLVRIDILNPLERGLSLPQSGNSFFKPGGFTIGNLYEGLINSPLKTDPYITVSPVTIQP